MKYFLLNLYSFSNQFVVTKRIAITEIEAQRLSDLDTLQAVRRTNVMILHIINSNELDTSELRMKGKVQTISYIIRVIVKFEVSSVQNRSIYITTL